MCGHATLLAQIRQVVNSSLFSLHCTMFFHVYASKKDGSYYAWKVVCEEFQIYEKLLLPLSLSQTLSLNRGGQGEENGR